MAVFLLILKILGWVLAALLLLIAVVLLLPIRVVFSYDTRGFLLLYRLLWWEFGEEPDPDNPVAKAAVKVLGLDAIRSAEAVKEAVAEQGAAGTATQILGVLKLLLDRVFWLLPRARVTKLKLHSVSAGTDAADVAMDYGLVCAAVYPLVGLLKSNLRVSPRGEDVQIGCDYDTAEPRLDMEIVLSVPIFRVVAALWHVVWTNAKTQAQKEMQSHE